MSCLRVMMLDLCRGFQAPLINIDLRRLVTCEGSTVTLTFLPCDFSADARVTSCCVLFIVCSFDSFNIQENGSRCHWSVTPVELVLADRCQHGIEFRIHAGIAEPLGIDLGCNLDHKLRQMIH